MDRHRHNIGDVVRIREWDDMKSEFGLDNSGSINCPASFVPYMRKYCGRIATIKEYSGEFYHLNEFGWAFSDEMFEDYDEISDSIDDAAYGEFL